MRLCVMSDLHLEYERRGHLRAGNPPQGEPIGPRLAGLGGVDLVVLAGDIDEGLAGLDYAERVAGEMGCQVAYVPGNHEYYGSPLPELRAAMRSRNGAVALLDQRCLRVGDWVFAGCTLWTDYGLYGTAEVSKGAALRGLEDHRWIRWAGDRLFAPEDAATLFDREHSWLADTLEREDPRRTVVVTHHAPLPDCIAPRFAGGALSPAFASDLREMILRYQPALWIYGHTHHDADVMVGRTRVVSRQRGYWGVDDISTFVPLVMSI